MSEKDNLSKIEIQIAKENGFILCGKTGSGKTTLLNAIFDKTMGKVERSKKIVTEKTTVYYYKLENGKCISIIDTPGIDDTQLNNEKIININLEGIIEEISKNNIQVKGIIFLTNFQDERFDVSEQMTLLEYNKIFPFPRFWKNLIVIFTHYFGDPDGEDVEEMKKERDRANGVIFEELMEKVQEVSEPINYQDLQIKYFNSYYPINSKYEKKRMRNMKNRDELEIEFDKLINSEPLFSSIEIIRVKDYIMEENGKKYLADIKRIGYFLKGNNKPIKENIKIISRKEIYDDKEEIKNKEEINDKEEIKKIYQNNKNPSCLIF